MTERQYVIPTRPGMGRGLVNHDERSKAYRALDLAATRYRRMGYTTTMAPRTKSWVRGGPYDQGNTPECVAYTGKGLLNTQQLSATVPYAIRSKYDTEAFYRGAQQNDEWTGEDYEGTSGLGLCRFLKRTGKISAYHWNFGLDETLLCLSWVGPVGIGIMWTDDMFEPDADGYLHATGGDAGGHEIEVTAIDVKRMRVEVTNSWGPGWGRKGRAYMSFDTLGGRLDNDGDSLVITA